VSHVPSWWEAVLLAGAAFRMWRLLAVDTVLDRPRDWYVKADNSTTYMQGLDEFIRCPWCLGFWVATGWWVAWLIWPHGVLVVATWWAIAAAVGLLAKLDS